MYDRYQSFGTLPMYIILLESDVRQTVTPSLAALIISMIIPQGPAALPDFILLIALDTIPDVILIVYYFITINIYLALSCNTCEKYVRDKSSITCYLCHSKFI